jgi:hypothetical protein
VRLELKIEVGLSCCGLPPAGPEVEYVVPPYPDEDGGVVHIPIAFADVDQAPFDNTIGSPALLHPCGDVKQV